MGRLYRNNSVEAVSSTPPPDFVEAAVPGTAENWDRLNQRPQKSFSLRSGKKVSGLHTCFISALSY